MSLQQDMVSYRAKERISQSELANRTGLSTQTINSVENGLQEPSKVTAEKIKQVIYAE